MNNVTIKGSSYSNGDGTTNIRIRSLVKFETIISSCSFRLYFNEGLVILLIILIFGGDLTNDCDKGYFNRITKYEYARQK